MTLPGAVLGHSVAAIGLTTCLNTRQEVMLSVAIGVGSRYNPPFSSRTYAKLYDDAVTHMGNQMIKHGPKAARIAGRAGKSAGKRVARSVIVRTAAKSAGKMTLRAIPYVGWALLAYDVVDFAIGDDPSLIGDILDVAEWALM